MESNEERKVWEEERERNRRVNPVKERRRIPPSISSERVVLSFFPHLSVCPAIAPSPILSLFRSRERVRHLISISPSFAANHHWLREHSNSCARSEIRRVWLEPTRARASTKGRRGGLYCACVRRIGWNCERARGKKG